MQNQSFWSNRPSFCFVRSYQVYFQQTITDPFFFIFVYSTVKSKMCSTQVYTNWTLTGFELRTSVVRSNLSAKWATTSAPLIMFLIEKLYPSLDSNPGRLQCNCPLKKRPRLLCFCELFNDGALLSGKRQVGTTFSLQSLFRQLMRGLGRGSRHCKYLFIVLGGRQTG